MRLASSRVSDDSPRSARASGRERHTNEQYEEAGDLRFGSASDEAEAAGHNGDICPRPTTTYGADPDAKIGRFLLFVGIRRGEGAKEPFRRGKRFFLSTGRENMNPCRFARAYLGRDFVQALDNTGVFPAGFASPQPKSAPRKLRSTCELAIFEGFLRPTNAAGLAPSK